MIRTEVTLELRLLEAQTERQAPIDTVSVLVSDELVRREDRLLDRCLAQARPLGAGLWRPTLRDQAPDTTGNE